MTQLFKVECYKERGSKPKLSREFLVVAKNTHLAEQAGIERIFTTDPHFLRKVDNYFEVKAEPVPRNGR